MSELPQKTLTDLLNDIEQRANEVQNMEYNSVWAFRHAVGVSAMDVPALVKALRHLRSYVEILTRSERHRESAETVLEEVAQLLREPADSVQNAMRSSDASG